MGVRDMTGALQRVLVRRPPDDCSEWQRYGWRSEPDPVLLAAEHEGLCSVLESAGAEVVSAEPTTLDAIYVFDPALVADESAVLLQPGKNLRRDEPEALGTELERAGTAVAARLEEHELAEGGDLIRFDERTRLAGRGYRTNRAGIRALERLLGLETVAFDLPHLHGPGSCLHLLSLLSPLADDLVVGYPPLMPVPLVELLAERCVQIVHVPADEFETLGPNALALAPRVALVPKHNIDTRRRLEAAGVEVLVYRAEELSKGDGGPTCLTLPLARDTLS